MKIVIEIDNEASEFIEVWKILQLASLRYVLVSKVKKVVTVTLSELQEVAFVFQRGQAYMIHDKVGLLDVNLNALELGLANY